MQGQRKWGFLGHRSPVRDPQEPHVGTLGHLAWTLPTSEPHLLERVSQSRSRTWKGTLSPNYESGGSLGCSRDASRGSLSEGNQKVKEMTDHHSLLPPLAFLFYFVSRDVGWGDTGWRRAVLGTT